MRRLLVWAVLGLGACDRRAMPPSDALAPPVAVRSRPTVSDLPVLDRPAPPVPQPTRELTPADFQPPSPMPAPAEVVAFLRAHASGVKPWHVTVYGLDGVGQDFAGYRVASTSPAEPRLADELITRLGNGGSYADVRCESPRLGVRIERDGAALSFVADCRLRLDGTRDVAGFSPEMLVFLMKLEAASTPCQWVRLDYFDLEACVDRTMHYGGGAELMALNGTRCRQVVISGLQRPDDPYTRRVGNVEVSCTSDPVEDPACAAICDSLRPTPNSTATGAFPEGPPAIQLQTSGGFVGATYMTKIWRDGTVVFSGPGCAKLRGARARLDPQAVTDLLARLALEVLARESQMPCVDCFRTEVHVLVDDELVELYGQAAELVNAVAGPNPC